MDRTRLRITVNGIVQGVGFRPFVFRLARDRKLTGWVSNTASGVILEVEGSPEAVRSFPDLIRASAPPLALIDTIATETLPPNGDVTFAIRPSRQEDPVHTLISPDAAVCPDCLRELFDPSDRRYRYPFINCTNCGPRYTIIRSIPYDRPATTMASFTMCPDCRREYEDPSDRRFHAQPNACPVCGPRVELWDRDGKPIPSSDPLRLVMEQIRQGAIVAVKGLGGFHLAVDAFQEEAVRRLRRRKGREAKPLALMARDLATVRQHVRVRPEENAFLQSPRAPIVLLQKRPDSSLAPSLAPGNDRLGFMLPYTPLHHILLQEEPRVLVMTSANWSEEPICTDNREAVDRLRGLADFYLVHDREIYFRCDDSVWIFLADAFRPLRRSRGFVPQPVFVSGSGPTLLGVGAELKNTICLLKDDQALLSQHIGDLKNLEARDFFLKTIDHFQTIFETRPEYIVADHHPAYLSTQWARSQTTAPVITVQHHQAHLAALLAEHRHPEPVIGLILDGTGLGTDGQIWGGEILVGNGIEVERRGHLASMPLPGGDAAIRHPWRIATGYLEAVFGDRFPDLPFLGGRDPGPVRELVRHQVQTPLTTSCGRLFDAVAALAGGRATIQYEAQAAIEFMQAVPELPVRGYRPEWREEGRRLILDVPDLIRQVVQDIRTGRTLPVISGRFHRYLVDAFLLAVRILSRDTGLRTVGLSGGVFQNQVLLEALVGALQAAGYEVLTHRQVPCNDGGISLGQVWAGRGLVKQ